MFVQWHIFWTYLEVFSQRTAKKQLEHTDVQQSDVQLYFLKMDKHMSESLIACLVNVSVRTRLKNHFISCKHLFTCDTRGKWGFISAPAASVGWAAAAGIPAGWSQLRGSGLWKDSPQRVFISFLQTKLWNVTVTLPPTHVCLTLGWDEGDSLQGSSNTAEQNFEGTWPLGS